MIKNFLRSLVGALSSLGVLRSKALPDAISALSLIVAMIVVVRSTHSVINNFIVAGLFTTVYAALMAYRVIIDKRELRDARKKLQEVRKNLAANRSSQILIEKKISVTSMFIADKSRKSALNYTIISITICWTFFVSKNASLPAICLLLSFAVAILMDAALISYRVRKGYFGNNEAEARELVSYIIANSAGFDGGGGGFRVFDAAEPEIELASSLAPYLKGV